MESTIELGSHTITMGQPLPAIEMVRIPEEIEGETVYVGGIYADVNYTDIDASGNVLPLALHQTISEFTINDGKNAWGPDHLDGSQLAALHFLWTGLPIPYQTDANGDATVASGSDATRRFITGYNYAALGLKPTDFSPPATAIRKGNILTRMSGLPTNMTGGAGTITYTAHVFTAAEKRAVPRVTSAFVPLNSLDMVQPFSGKLASLVLSQNTSDWTRAMMTFLRLHLDNGELLEYSPADYNIPATSQNPEVTAARLQRHFCETIGGTEPRFISVFPFRPGRRVAIGDMADSSSYRLEIDGTLTPSQGNAIYTMVERLEPSKVVKQLSGCGCNEAPLRALAAGGLSKIGYYKTASKMPLQDPTMVGYLPFKLDPERVKGFGIIKGE